MKIVSGRKWLASLIIIGLSFLGGGLFYILWMIAAVPAARSEEDILTTALWIVAPVITAIGFTTGAYLSERKLLSRKTGFTRLLIWPLIGCMVGAWSVYCFGPMLIVFGMLSLGAISILLRELFLFYRSPAQEGGSSSGD